MASSNAPVVFISAASVDLKTWREHLHRAFSRAGFRVLTQEQSLRSAPGDVKRLLTETIDEADCVIHLAGMGYGSDATDPFPAAPAFQCSWTQFEYYHAHEKGKDVIAFVCAPNLSAPDFKEESANAADLARKQRLQTEHRARVTSGQFTGTPLETNVPRTVNETADSAGKLLESVACAVGTLRNIEREDREKAQQELRAIASSLEGINKKLIAALVLLVLIGIGVWLVKRDTGTAKQNTEQIIAKQETADKKTDDLAAKLSAVQEALSRIQQQTDPAKDPISKWPQARLEQALAEQLKIKVEDLRALLTAGRTSLDALVAGQALLASGQRAAAGEKFNVVIQEEKAAVQRLRQAWEGKAQIAFDAVHYEEALDYRQKAAALADKNADPLDWADAAANVEFILDKLARYKEAEPLDREIVRIREAKLGPNDPKLAVALNNLALLLQATNRLSDAEPLMRRALAIDEASYGKDHPNVATALNNLADLLKNTNRLSDAEPLMRRALAIDEASYGKDHPKVAIRLNNLAQLLKDTNRLSDAEPLMRRALAICENSMGKDHPYVANCLNNLATLLQATNRLSDAEPLMRRALAIDEASFGKDHPNVARDLNNLALLLKATNRLSDAEPLMRRALAINEASFGKDHPNVAIDLNNLAALLQATNRLSDAEPLMRRALAIDEASFGKDHPDVAIDLNNLAQLLKATNRLSDAEPLMRRALAIDENSFGKDHPKVAIRLNNLVTLLYATNRLSDAEPLMRRALAIDEASFGKDHPKVAIRLNNLAQLLQDTNRLSDAEPLMRRALAIDEASFGKDHPDVAIDLNNLAQLLQATNRLSDAEPLMRRALAIFEASLGKEHPNTKGVAENLRLLLDELGK